MSSHIADTEDVGLSCEIARLREQQHAADVQRLVQLIEAERRRADNLETALKTSRQIGAAIGILMERHKCTADEAFEILRARSQRGHGKLRDIAADLLATGQLDVPAPAN